jgi:hypothetical protein
MGFVNLKREHFVNIKSNDELIDRIKWREIKNKICEKTTFRDVLSSTSMGFVNLKWGESRINSLKRRQYLAFCVLILSTKT